MNDLECGFCGGIATKNPAGVGYVHAADGDRVRRGGPGDFVSDRHNRAGTRVMPYDLVDPSEEDE